MSGPEDSNVFDLQEEINRLWKETEDKYSNNKNLSGLFSQIQGCDSAQKIETFLANVREEHDQRVDPRRKKGINRAAMSTIQFCSGLSKFLDTYSGIADIVKGANSLGGGIAYGGLKTLLMASISLNMSVQRAIIGGLTDSRSRETREREKNVSEDTWRL